MAVSRENLHFDLESESVQAVILSSFLVEKNLTNWFIHKFYFL